MTNESIAILISVISILIAVINTLYSRDRIKKLTKFQNENFNYNQNKDKDDFILNFKDDLHELRFSMLELYTTKSEIKLENKGHLLYLLESKYNKAIIIKYLNNSIYERFMILKIKTDESLDKVIFKQDYSSISLSIKNIKIFLDSVNNHINNI